MSKSHATYVLPRVITNRWYQAEEYWQWACACGDRGTLTYSHQSAVAAAINHETGYTTSWDHCYERSWQLYPAYTPLAVRESWDRGMQNG